MYPVRYEADFVEQQDRAKAFFRWILVIPWLIVGSIYGLVAQFIALIAWFALLFTGRYPQGLYDFQAGFLRFSGRLNGYAWLQTEEWPPFGIEDDPSYPVRVAVDPPLEKYNRWKVFFRLILGIPVLIMMNLMPYFTLMGATVAWLQIVFLGRTSGGVHNAITLGNAYLVRAAGYFLLVTETLPPISDQEPAGIRKAPPAPKALPQSSSPKPKAPAKKKAAPAKKSAAKAPAKKSAPKKKAAAKRKPQAR